MTCLWRLIKKRNGKYLGKKQSQSHDINYKIVYNVQHLKFPSFSTFGTGNPAVGLFRMCM